MRIDRLMSIIIVLLEKERVTAETLSDMFEVSKRTIYRDIDSIDLAGIPIRSVAGVNGGFEIMSKYKLDQSVFNKQDITSILTGLSGLSNIMDNQELLNSMTKIKSLIPDQHSESINLKLDQIHLDLTPWSGFKSTNQNITLIKESLDQLRILSFSYINHQGLESTREVEPCQLILKNSQWYLYAFCLLKEDYRIFKLSRIKNLEVSNNSFTFKTYPQPLLNVDDHIESTMILINLKVHHSKIEMILDYTDYDSMTKIDDDYYSVQFPFIENDFYYNILLSFGDLCEVIEPLSIREEMMHKVNSIYKLYNI